MKIGIDISQIVYEGTGVAEYAQRLVGHLLTIDIHNEYVLFFSNRKKFQISNFLAKLDPASRDKFQINSNIQNTKYKIQMFRIPISLLEFLWNRLHIFPIEWLIGDVDVFYTSDWVEPPTIRAKKVTTIHDLSIFKVPESFDDRIITVHKRKLEWVKKESSAILCDSKATKKDAMEILGIESERLQVVYPGL